jgi:hypothetical protein
VKGADRPAEPGLGEPANPQAALFCASLAALFVELMLIRWVSSQVPTLAYFKNFPLLAAFSGLGVGCLIARVNRSYWAPSLWVLGGLAVCVACADIFGWDSLVFPEPNLDIWELTFGTRSPALVFTRSLGTIFLILAACAFSFFGVGQLIGALLQDGSPLRMYTLDILGSLTGVLLFSFLSFLQTPPHVWLVVATILLWLALRCARLDRFGNVLPLTATLVAALVAFERTADSGAFVTRWSPYYLIEVERVNDPSSSQPKYYHLSVNRFVHQVMVDLEDDHRERYRPNTPDWNEWMMLRAHYDFPYIFKPAPRSVLIGGAGTGNDVAAALRNHAGHVTAVEIDPAILLLGRQLHPSHPYAPDRPVVIVNTDIRSFLARSNDRFDLIVLSILDSHTALSSLSSLRLENYVYTAEAMRDAVSHLTPNGIMCLSFYESDRIWLGQRLYNTIKLGTGEAPVPMRLGPVSAFVFGPGLTREEIVERLGGTKAGFQVTEALHGGSSTRPATDDWPFFYSSPSGQPLVYYLCLAILITATAILVRWGLRQQGGTASLASDWQMFFLGAGFLLIETKALAEMALLFGSTWIVNTFVFAGIFLMVLAANWVVDRSPRVLLRPAYALLAASLLAWYVFPRAALNALDFLPRGIVGTLLVVFPIFFAGLIFGSAFAQRKEVSLAFGSNLTGAVVGGAAEAMSLLWGIRALTLLALLFYAMSWASSSATRTRSPRRRDGRESSDPGFTASPGRK